MLYYISISVQSCISDPLDDDWSSSTTASWVWLPDYIVGFLKGSHCWKGQLFLNTLHIRNVTTFYLLTYHRVG